MLISERTLRWAGVAVVLLLLFGMIGIVVRYTPEPPPRATARITAVATEDWSRAPATTATSDDVLLTLREICWGTIEYKSEVIAKVHANGRVEIDWSRAEKLVAEGSRSDGGIAKLMLAIRDGRWEPVK